MGDGTQWEGVGCVHAPLVQGASLPWACPTDNDENRCRGGGVVFWRSSPNSPPPFPSYLLQSGDGYCSFSRPDSILGLILECVPQEALGW